MRELICLVITILFSTNVFGQNSILNQLKEFEGIWIAEDYLKSFELTKSSIKSKSAFNPNYPVGLRINTSEIENNKLNIGFSTLHDHGIRPEVSRFLILNGDTVCEQGSFQINIQSVNPSNSYRTTEIFDCNSFLSWTFSPDTLLILFKSSCKKEKSATIKYKRVGKIVDSNYLYPNPLYFYTRTKTLSGNYTLIDSLNNIVSTDFSIGLNGEAKGYLPFDNKIFYFSTDVYCGEPVIEDYVVIGTKNDKPFSVRSGFVYKLVNESTIQFHASKWIIGTNAPFQQIGKVIFTLKRK